ncbi:MAG: hypothetical protein AAF603_06115 [Pseudomonadota bacterium]
MKRFFLLLPLSLLACGEKEATAPTDDAPTISSSQSAEGTYPFHDLWANSFTDCRLTPGSAEEAPIAITPTELIGYENTCAISQVVVIEGEGRYEAMMDCLGEGQTSPETLYLRLRNDSLMVEWETGENVTWTRCPSSLESE